KVAGAGLVGIYAQPISSSPAKTLEDLRSQDGTLRVELRVRPDRALEACLESTTPRWGEDAAVLRWNPENGEEKTLVAALSEVTAGIWQASVLLEDVAEPGQLQVPLEPVTWQDLSEDSDLANVVSVSLSAATSYPETLSGWLNASSQLPEPIRSEVTSVLNAYG
ncbi:hypothetical protein, partial [Mycobacterium sp.]|uniref:hypothetical protein n=1 Tax=Mycobacterium sp. TaxID=1785 RepID=UPI003BAF649C